MTAARNSFEPQAPHRSADRKRKQRKRNERLSTALFNCAGNPSNKKTKKGD